MKPNFTRYLSKESILILEGNSKREILEQLITAAAEQSNIDRDIIHRLTWKRESMMTTGVGHGLALPHIRINNIPEPVVLVAVCKNPIEDYQSQDEKPIRLLVYIAAPEDNQEEYLKLLGSVSKKLRDPAVIDEIIENITRPSIILRILKRRSANES